VDRIGQQRTVHAVHLAARQTSEETILARLAMRIERTRQVLGPLQSPLGVVSEGEVAEAVFARRVPRSPADAFALRKSSSETPAVGDAGTQDLFVRDRFSAPAREEVRRLERIRALTSRRRGDLEDIAATLVRTAPWWTTLRLRGLCRTTPATPGFASHGAIIALFSAEVVDGRGLLLDQILVALQCKARMVELLEPGGPAMAALDAEAERCAARRLAELREIVPPRLLSGSRRNLAIAGAGDRVPVVACQPGLFDRRALRQAGEDRQARVLRQEDDTAQIDAIARAVDLSLAGPPRLMLIAVLEPRCPIPVVQGRGLLP
jgi:hypothetical protein